MRFLTIQLDSIYSFSSDSDEEKANKKARREARAERLAEVGITTPKNLEDDYDDAPIIAVTETQYIDLIQAKISIAKVLGVSDAGNALDPKGAIDRVEKLIGKIEKFAERTANLQYNERVEVHTPGMGLMLFNTVMLAEDACSDQLQTHLDEGWKIIAACPQPNQRRPDYILGRYDPSRSDKTGISTYAERG